MDGKPIELTDFEINVLSHGLSALTEKYAAIENEPDVASHIGLVFIDELQTKLLDGRSADISIRKVSA